MYLPRFENHCHSMYSNFRLLDSINKPKQLIDKAIEFGLSGITLTDHETVAGIPELFDYAEQIYSNHPDFKVAAGNEIYLTGSRESGQKYYHFILIAKNRDGWEALKQLSSESWMQSYHDRGLERVPTLYKELEEILKKYPNSLIGTSACIGGELSSTTLQLIEAERIGNKNGAAIAHKHIVNFLLWCKNLFKDDFYIECAPACSKDQIAVNRRLLSIAKAFEIKMVVGCDAHYLRPEDAFIHESYLNSKGGEREVKEFYEYAYLQTNEEIIKHLSKSDYDKEYVKQMFNNSYEIYQKIEKYSIWHNQTIPSVEVKEYPKQDTQLSYPHLKEMFKSDDVYDRYWVNQCFEKMEEKHLDTKEYLERLEEEATTKSIIGNKLGTNLFKYPIVLQHYIDKFWELGSTIGAGRGSSCSGLNHYLLGVTQLDPLKWNLPWFRYLNEERVELPDIDIDLAPSKRPAILKMIKEERGKNFQSDISQIAKENLGCTLIATYGTESAKSAIQTACRGYRSEQYPDGIDNDISAYLSSLIPKERGFVWDLKDVYYGNKEKGRKPVMTFVNEVNKYPRLMEIIFGIEGLIKQRGSHASGVILNDENPYEFLAYMKSPEGEIISQFDLHTAERMGATKYDFLVTSVQDKLTECIRLLQKYSVIDVDLSLREVYDKYFHPDVLNLKNEEVWKHIKKNDILDFFQFDSQVGSQGIAKIQPNNIRELTDANGLIRLMTNEKGQESPLDRYARMKKDINLWYQEMVDCNLTEEEQKTLEPYYLESYGTPPSQEQLMLYLMDKNICNFSLKDANAARKIIGKKQMNKIPELKDKVYHMAKSPALADYIWQHGVALQLGYAFSKIHALAYSMIGYQTADIATQWNPIFWNTSCLIVNSGSLEDSDKGSDYAKIAIAIGNIMNRNIKMSLVDINKSSYTFEPDVDNGTILYGLKPISNINVDIIKQIEEGRPYKSIKDFMKRCPLKKTAMINLIKGGAFDNLPIEEDFGIKAHPRILTMIYYISQISEPKKRLTMQNFNGLLKYNLIPKEYDFEIKTFYFNKKLKAHKYKENYIVKAEDIDLFLEKYDLECSSQVMNDVLLINQKEWDKLYKIYMMKPKQYILDNQEKLLKQLNNILFKETWDKYAEGSLSHWEMDSLCFYYNEHELKNVNYNTYGLQNFDTMPREPRVERTWKRKSMELPIYALSRIIGTVIAKDDNHANIYILTPEMKVVTVKFTRDQYAMYKKQISERQDDGTKKIKEKSWFTRGTKLMLTGFRREDTFVIKTYKNTSTHSIYKITNVNKEGEMELVHERYTPTQEDE